MIDCPLQNTAITIFGIGFQVRTRKSIKQWFGENKVSLYKELGMKGHNGIDFGVPIGTKVFAPFDGYIKAYLGKDGYGNYIRIRSPYKSLECVLGHMSSIYAFNKWVNSGDLIGLTGNTGNSTGPHLHFGVRQLNKEDKNVWDLSVRNYNNGYFGYYDISSQTKEWKGTLVINNK